MKKTIRFIAIIGAFVCFALSTVDLDVHECQDELNNPDNKQTAFQEIHLTD